MTTPSGTNIAQDDAYVEVQAETIHGDVNIYRLPPDATPEETFRLGVEYLDARVPQEARKLIEQAVTKGYVTDEVRFHHLLALLSGRTLRQLASDDFNGLSFIYGSISRLRPGDEWAAGLRAILRLINSLNTPDTDLTADKVIKEIDELYPRQRDKIFDHLGGLLEGRLQDRIWHRSVERARAGQLAGERAERIWMFFHPTPAPARVLGVVPESSSTGDRLRVAVSTAGFAVAMLAIGLLLLRRGELLPILGYLAVATGVPAVVAGGADRHFRRARRRTKEAALAPSLQPQPSAPAGGFASKVDRLFDRYFRLYVPRNTDPYHWRQQTSGIRRHLRDELVEIYREQRVEADRIAWLVRYLVSDVRTRWEHDTLTAYRTELRVPPLTLARYWGGLAAVVAGSLWVVPAAVLAAPGRGTTAVLIAVTCGVVGTRAWFRIVGERRRVEADRAERSREFAARQAALERWRAKLARKPSDAEMASWLECDRKLLVDEAMRHYRLRPSQVIAHTFIEAPAPPYKRARVPRGPWRYSRYRLLLFLLTDDGVRQVNIELDFERGTSHRTQRLNYRFDAVAAVRIDGIATQRQTFELTLVNGDPIRVQVTEANTRGMQPGEDPLTLSEVELDASGLGRTLHVLEGIAAEGKEWIRHQRERADKRLADLASTVADLLD